MLEAGIVSEETYIEQGDYWEKTYRPLIKYVLDTYDPDLALVGYPVADEVQHQFLGLVTPRLPNGDRNPSYDDVAVDGTRDGRVQERARFIRDAYEGADATMRLAQKHMRDRDLTTFASSDHGFAPQFLAIDASKVLVDLKLLSKPQTSNCRPATGETIGKAKACFAGGALQIYLNQAGRDPVDPTGALKQVPAADAAATVAQIKAAFLGPRGSRGLGRGRVARGLGRDRPRLHQGGGAGGSRTAAAARPTCRTRRGPATSWCSRTRRTSSTRPRRAR